MPSSMDTRVPLSSRGFLCVASGVEALELFRKSLEEGAPFSVVLLDQNMPVMDGYEVAGKIRLLSKKHSQSSSFYLRRRPRSSPRA